MRRESLGKKIVERDTDMKIYNRFDFWTAVLIIIVTVGLMVADHLSFIHFGYFVGPFRANHWFVWIGTLYVAFAVPIIAVLKQRYPRRCPLLFRFHIFGNLIAFLLVSLHFAGQIDRPATAYPTLGTGLALYIVMILLVATGFIHQFELIPQIKPETRRFVHVGLIFAFYIVIVIHILHGLGYI